MQQVVKIDCYGFAPSFSCYSSDSITSKAVAKVIREEQAADQFHEIVDFEGDEFEFSLASSDEEVSVTEIDSIDWTIFPVFNRDGLVNDEVDREINVTGDEIDDNSAITVQLGKVFHGEAEESSSYSSSEADESETRCSATYSAQRPKADGGSSPLLTKSKNSRSTGSGSKRWIFRFLLRRTKSEGKQPTVVKSTPKKADNPKQKRNSGEVSTVGGRRKAQTPVHEQFYMQRRAENEIGKRKSYLPYRKDLVGLFSNVNGTGKLLRF